MKKIFQISVLLVLAGVACKKVENKVYLEESTAPQITASESAVRLEPGEENNTAIRFNWTNPNYKFSTGTTLQDISYTLEIDTLGANFTSKNKYETVVARDLSKIYSVAELNSIFGNTIQIPVGLTIPRKTYTFEARVTASIGGSAKLTSNVVKFTARPFAPPPKVDPPASATLWITGEATNGNWMCGCPADQTSAAITNQKFTRQSTTLYVLDRIRLNADKEYLLVPRYGNWNAVSPDPEKFGFTKGTNDMNPIEDEFQRFGNNFKAPAVTADYKIEVNFQTGRLKLTKL